VYVIFSGMMGWSRMRGRQADSGWGRRIRRLEQLVRGDIEILRETAHGVAAVFVSSTGIMSIPAGLPHRRILHTAT
jgi:hypothetical protein